jgi:hypothetical protein
MLYLVVLLSLLVAPSAFGADELFLCEDGTFTNIVERMCAPYTPKGVVMIAPQGATFASVRSMFPQTEQKAADFPDPVSVCNLYKEWQMLNLRTGGGVTFRNTQDVPRWLSLSRIFTAIGAPHCD